MAWVVSNKGVPHESLWPYTISQFDVEPSSNVVTDALNAKATTVSTVATSVNGIKAAINEPVPVMFTFDVYNAYEDATNNGGKIGMPSGGSIGGHCNMVVGYNDTTSNLDGSTGAFIVRNSWGTSWGAAGYGYMPYGYAEQGYMASGYVVTAESEIVAPTPAPPTPTAADNLTLTAAVRTYQAGID
jgi:C1A family cysteine protease